ncbi:unnamed protein product [Chilo suppressalis]|uniref:Uncharacterized protein n=1 Tax=Chilo suppressalis TaxID=168631 RepID=A0ABN8B290_CHISP|nr:unnamed protein product [Chilo suppressalis]
MEASGTVDFVCRAAKIMNRTIVMTVFLACLSTLPVIMLIMGVQYIRDCPAEPRIPVYMVVGGAAGGAGICWLLWAQLASRSSNSSASIPERVLAYTLTIFLMGWFAFGNYWTLGILWPDYAPTLFEPNQWCHRTLYVFALTQLGVVWGVVLLLMLLLLALVVCQQRRSVVLELWHRNINNTMDVAGALLPFTHVVRPELTIHVQEVLTHADAHHDKRIPEINEPCDADKLNRQDKGDVKVKVKVNSA